MLSSARPARRRPTHDRPTTPGRVDSTLGERFPGWTRGNAADVFPEPFSPLGQSIDHAQGHVHRAARRLHQASVCSTTTSSRIPSPARPVQGVRRVPVQPAHPDPRVFGARMPGATPEAIDRAFFDEHADVPAYVHEDWHDSPKHEAKLGESAGFALMSATVAARASTPTRSSPRPAAGRAAPTSRRSRDSALCCPRSVHGARTSSRRSRAAMVASTLSSASARVRSAPSVRPSAIPPWPSGCWPVSRSTPVRRRTPCGRWVARPPPRRPWPPPSMRGPDTVLDELRASATILRPPSGSPAFDQFLYDFGFAWPERVRRALAVVGAASPAPPWPPST